jgi:hypothetical protein
VPPVAFAHLDPTDFFTVPVGFHAQPDGAPVVIGDRLQSWIARLVGNPWFWIAAIAVPFSWPIFLSLTSGAPAPIPILGRLPEFAAADQLGRPLGNDELKARTWVMDFAALDEPATEASIAALERVQYRARNLGQTFGIITWVLDGDGDRSRVAGYVKTRPISPRMWRFVPATPPAVSSAAKEAIAKMVGGPLSGVDETRFGAGNTLFLVDSESRLRGIYDASDTASIDKLLHDAGLVINRGY